MNWYYADAGKQVGPVDRPFLDQLVASGKVRDDTLVWHEGMESWQPLRDVWGPIPAAEAPARHFRYAGFWIRFAARVIDAVLLAIVNAIVKIPLAIMLGVGAGWHAGMIFLPMAMSLMGVSVILSLGIGVVYEAYFVSTRAGTPGKLALGLRIVRADGSPVSGSVAVGRYFAQWLSAMILMIGYIMAGFDPEKRALHDRICQTRVIHAG